MVTETVVPLARCSGSERVPLSEHKVISQRLAAFCPFTAAPWSRVEKARRRTIKFKLHM